MPGPYPLALRERVVQAYDDGEGTQRELAVRFMIHRNALAEWLRLRRETGSLMPRPMGGARGELLINKAGEAILEELVREVPESTISELADAYADRTDVEVGDETVRTTLHRLGWSFKKGLSGKSPTGEPMWSKNERHS